VQRFGQFFGRVWIRAFGGCFWIFASWQPKLLEIRRNSADKSKIEQRITRMGG
jgi:hypothetical protein